MEPAEKLPNGWIRVKSKSKAGKYYFFNKVLNVSLWRIEDLEKHQQQGKATSDKKTPKKALPKATLKPPLKTSATFKVTKKNVAKDRLEDLQNKLQAEVKASRAKEVKNGSKSSSPVKPAKQLDSVHLGGLQEIVKLREVKQPNNDVKNGALQRMAKIRKQQSDNVESSSKKKEENNNVVPHKKQKTEPDSDVDMMDISVEDVESQALSEYESMDWEDIPEQEVIEHVQKARSTVNSEPTSRVLPKSSLTSQRSAVDFFVVVDTNVLLSNIDFLKQIKGKMFKDVGKATIYLPYIVLRELDHLKSNQSVERQARRAIAFIDDCFKSRDAFVMGQSAIENNQRTIIPIDGGDDEILNCCLLLQEKTKKIILLTNDKNLRNKAFVNKLEAQSRDMLYSTDFNIKNQITFE